MEFRTPNGGSYNPETPAAQASHQAPAQHHPQHPQPAQHPAAKKRRLNKPGLPKDWLKWLVGLIIAVVIVFFAYGYFHTKQQLNATKKSENSAQQTTQQLITNVGKLVELPTGETPTVATVNDASKLKSQAFFADAKNGDKVLIYSHAGKAVLYRPSINKIIQYSQVNLNSQ